MKLQYVTLFLAVLFGTDIAAIGTPTGDDPIGTLRQKINIANLTTPANPETAKILGSQLYSRNTTSQSDELNSRLITLRSSFDSDSYGIPAARTVLRPRAVDPNDIQALSNKGHDLVCLMNAATEAQAQAFNQNRPVASTFTTYEQLARWGYSADEYGTAPMYEQTFRDYNPFYPALDYLDESGEKVVFDKTRNVEYAYLHFNDDDAGNPVEVYNDDGYEVQASLAKFINVVNVPGGAIIADDNISPTAKQKDDKSIITLPDLRNWSDVVFLQWQHFATMADVSVKSLRFICRSNVQNLETKQAAVTIFNELGLPYIPEFANRLTWDMNEGGPGQAILGTPNGAGGAYLLAQHKTQLGVKTFKSVQIWSGDDAPGWPVPPIGTEEAVKFLTLYLVFEVESVAA